jgi:hypothetical protein
MRAQPAAEEDSPLAVTPEIRPSAAWRVCALEVLGPYQLRVRFMDGTEGTVDLGALVQSPRAGVFTALADPAMFAQAFIAFGAVTWPGDIDLAPDALYAQIKQCGHCALH